MRRMKLAGGVVATLATLILLGVASNTAGAQAAPSDRFRVAPGVFLESQRAEGFARRGEPTKRQRSSTAQPSIVGGDQTTIQDWPWQVALTGSPEFYFGNALDRQFCGGSLVAPRIVITAAHCLFDDDTQTFGFVDEVSVVTGRTKLSSNEGAEVALKDYYFFTDRSGNELYDPFTSRWDVVVLELATPSPSQTIKLAGGDERELWSGGRDAYVTGWGSTIPPFPGGGFPNALRVARVAMVSDSGCGAQFSSFRADVMVCAGVVQGRSACFGDSGGPLVVPMAGGGYRLVGDTSFGPEECGTKPSVHGRLAANPIRKSLREGILKIAGVDVVGSGASPPTDKACEKAKKKLKKAKKKLKKAKKSGKPEKIKKAKKKLKKAKKQKRKKC